MTDQTTIEEFPPARSPLPAFATLREIEAHLTEMATTLRVLSEQGDFALCPPRARQETMLMSFDLHTAVLEMRQRAMETEPQPTLWSWLRERFVSPNPVEEGLSS
jgi:hypothetical protein